jgi:hypothetical protein
MATPTGMLSRHAARRRSISARLFLVSVGSVMAET